MGRKSSNLKHMLLNLQRRMSSLQDVVRGFAETHTMIRDRNGKIRYWSRGTAQLFGFTAPEAVGTHANTLLCTEFPQPLAEIEDTLLALGGWQGELLRRHRDGHEVHVASHWILRRRSGRGHSVMEVNNDITDRAASEQIALYYSAIVENSNDAIISKDLSGIITSWNAAAEAIFGWRSHEVIGQPISVLIPEGRMQEEADILALLRRGEKLTQYETLRRHRDGHDVLISLTTSPIRDKHGTIVGASKIARDITSMRQTEHLLSRARRAQTIGELTSGATHDFNNLLSIITGNIDVLTPMLPPGSEAVELANEILTAALSGTALTDRLLGFARGQEAAPRIIDLGQEVPRHVALLRRVLGRAVGISVDMAPDVWPVQLDPAQLGDAMLNLAINARDAMIGKPGHLTIELANVRLFRDGIARDADPDGGRYVMLRITDDGTGMAPDILDRVSEPFFTTKPDGEGSGLGLSMVHDFIQRSGGIHLVESSVGHGTTVWIYLPHIEAQTDPLSRTAAPDEWPRGTETILIIDGDVNRRAMIAHQVGRLGYRSRTAADVAAAQDCLAGASRVDLVLLGPIQADLWSTLISAAPGNASVPKLLVMSNEPDDKTASARSGAVTVPGSSGWDQLARSIHHALDRRTEFK